LERRGAGAAETVSFLENPWLKTQAKILVRCGAILLSRDKNGTRKKNRLWLVTKAGLPRGPI
jgi:hypothetical protein